MSEPEHEYPVAPNSPHSHNRFPILARHEGHEIHHELRVAFIAP